MKLLPTPHSYVHSERETPLEGFSRVICRIPADDTLRWGLGELDRRFAQAPEAGTLTLQSSDDAFFAEKNAAEQGYILRRDVCGVTLEAQASAGFLYGLMTLLQLCGSAPETFEIRDRPEIRFRGCMNTLWAESGVWSYDFGDGKEAAAARLRQAIDEAARAKLNLMYADAFGFGLDRFPDYGAYMSALSDYARVRCVRLMAGGYGMGYGQSAHGSRTFMGRVFRNRDPYPDGTLYDCIGTCGHDPAQDPATLTGRSFGTCLSNDALTDDKIGEIRDYLRATGVSVLYMHNMDADQIHEPLWLGRCERCRARFPSDSLYAPDGAAGAFAAFYDRILTALRPEFPDLILCPVSPGYAYAVTTSDEAFEKCRRFWSSVLAYMKEPSGLIPLFRELFAQHEGSKLRFDLLGESLPACGCVFFSSGDGFYSDKIYTPSAAYAAAMRKADLIVCANGGALQKATAYANAEYLWSPGGSAFWNPALPPDFERQTAEYNALREGVTRPEGIWGAGGLLETSCELLFGEKAGPRVAGVFRLRGKNGECPIFTACNVELWTRRTTVNYPMLWDTPVDAQQQAQFRERFAESTIVTHAAREMLDAILAEEPLSDAARAHLAYLRDACGICAALCGLLTRYMDLYREADAFFADGTPVRGDFRERAADLIRGAQELQARMQAEELRPFDPLGGVSLRREELAEFAAYCTGQILQSLRTGQRVPPERRPPVPRNWW